MTTKIKISAHDLEIETGRYKNIARTCKWCQLSLGLGPENFDIQDCIENKITFYLNVISTTIYVKNL